MNWTDSLNSFLLFTFSSPFLAEILCCSWHPKEGGVPASVPFPRAQGRLGYTNGMEQRQESPPGLCDSSWFGGCTSLLLPSGVWATPPCSPGILGESWDRTCSSISKEKRYPICSSHCRPSPALVFCLLPFLASLLMAALGWVFSSHAFTPALHSAYQQQHDLRLIKGTNQFCALCEHSRLPHRQSH